MPACGCGTAATACSGCGRCRSATSEGRILRWYGISEDVDDQAQAELARQDVEERYRLAAKATNDAIWDHDFTQGVIDWSDNAAAIVGSRSRRWGGRRLHGGRTASIPTRN